MSAYVIVIRTKLKNRTYFFEARGSTSGAMEQNELDLTVTTMVASIRINHTGLLSSEKESG